MNYIDEAWEELTREHEQFQIATNAYDLMREHFALGQFFEGALLVWPWRYSHPSISDDIRQHCPLDVIEMLTHYMLTDHGFITFCVVHERETPPDCADADS